jgi:hypothetical protein
LDQQEFTEQAPILQQDYRSDSRDILVEAECRRFYLEHGRNTGGCTEARLWENRMVFPPIAGARF